MLEFSTLKEHWVLCTCHFLSRLLCEIYYVKYMVEEKFLEFAWTWSLKFLGYFVTLSSWGLENITVAVPICYTMTAILLSGYI